MFSIRCPLILDTYRNQSLGGEETSVDDNAWFAKTHRSWREFENLVGTSPAATMAPASSAAGLIPPVYEKSVPESTAGSVAVMRPASVPAVWAGRTVASTGPAAEPVTKPASALPTPNRSP